MTKQTLTCFYIVRHGQSEANVDEILAGQLESLLTGKGEIQAKETSLELKHIKFDAVFSSDLIRAKRTAEIIILEKKLAVITTQALRERSYGIYEGKPYHILNEALEKLRKNNSHLDVEKQYLLTLPSMEPFESVTSRLITFLREIAVGYPGKNILIVCHGGIMRYLLIHLGFATFKTLPPGNISNTGYIKLESDGVDFFIRETKGIEKISDL